MRQIAERLGARYVLGGTVRNVVSGLRQSGKSTLLQEERALAAGRTYHTLDDFAILAAARANPDSLMIERMTLDEVQRCLEDDRKH